MNSANEHLSPDMLDLWRSRTLDEKQRRILEDHIKVCTACFADLTAGQAEDEHQADVVRAETEGFPYAGLLDEFSPENNAPDCLSIASMNGYISNIFDPRQRLQTAEHIRNCQSCHGLEAELRLKSIPVSQRVATVQ